MARFTIAICTWIGMAAAAMAQPLSGGTGGAVPSPSNVSILPPVTPAPPMASPGDYPITREARAHEQYLLQEKAQAESVHQAAVARFQQRTRRLESQRWFGISNSARWPVSIRTTATTRPAGFPTIRSSPIVGSEAASRGVSLKASKDPHHEEAGGRLAFGRTGGDTLRNTARFPPTR